MNREREAEGGSRIENEPAIDSGGGFVRLRLDIAYDGTEFAGWAVQSGQRTVAGTLDDALSTVFRVPVQLRAAGRTDAGVHATGQVAHVDVPADALAHAYPRTARAGDNEFLPLVRRLARFLPADVRVLDIGRAAAGFDARFSALRRHYVYRLSTAPHGVEPQDARYVTAWPRRLDVDAMSTASRDLLGLHDFAAFCRQREGATTIRDLQRLEWSRDGDRVAAYVTADAFCWAMVRSLVGARTSTNAVDQTLRPTQPKLKGQGLSSQGASVNNRHESNNNDSQRTRSGVDVLVAALNNTTQAAEPAPTPMAFDPRQVTIEVEPRLNAVIVRDAPERLPRYEQLIAALDVEPQSLEIEATIIDVNTDRARELGINWRWNNDGREGSYTGTVPTTGAGGVASVVLGSLNQFFARIRALQTEGAARVVSSPQVVTLSNVEAIFDNTSTFFVRVAGREQVDLFNVSAGTSLRVMPHVFRDHNETRIKLMVNVEDGSLTGRTVDQIPIVERSTINTQALIAEGQSLLIGGMVRESNTSNVDKVPGLGDVPVLGNLFKSRTNSASRIERMFLITPRLAGVRPDATGASLRVANGTPAPGTPAAASAAATVAAGAPAQAPAVVAPAQRASVVLDLDALPASVPTAPVAPRTGTGGAVSPAARGGVSNPTR